MLLTNPAAWSGQRYRAPDDPAPGGGQTTTAPAVTSEPAPAPAAAPEPVQPTQQSFDTLQARLATLERDQQAIKGNRDEILAENKRLKDQAARAAALEEKLKTVGGDAALEHMEAEKRQAQVNDVFARHKAGEISAEEAHRQLTDFERGMSSKQIEEISQKNQELARQNQQFLHAQRDGQTIADLRKLAAANPAYNSDADRDLVRTAMEVITYEEILGEDGKGTGKEEPVWTDPKTGVPHRGDAALNEWFARAIADPENKLWIKPSAGSGFRPGTAGAGGQASIDALGRMSMAEYKQFREKSSQKAAH